MVKPTKEDVKQLLIVSTVLWETNAPKAQEIMRQAVQIATKSLGMDSIEVASMSKTVRLYVRDLSDRLQEGLKENFNVSGLSKQYLYRKETTGADAVSSLINDIMKGEGNNES